MKRIFVGTMFCGEGDLQQCLSAIHNQIDVDVEHMLISNLPEKEAHNRLWDAWRKRQNQFDLFVKIDADTVLRSSNVLRTVCNLMEANSNVTGIQAPLHDYFTDSHIMGLNCFRNNVIFQDTQSELYCDRGVDVGHNVVLRTNLPEELSPAALHCHYASEQQAFHFGLHRQLKNQNDIIAKVKKAYDKNHDKLRGLVLHGANRANRLRTTFNYTDIEFLAEFNDVVSNYDSLHL